MSNKNHRSKNHHFVWEFSSRVVSVCLVALSFLVVGCEPPPISSLTAEEGIARIRENHSEERWDSVTADVTEYRSRYPYSKFAAEAELLQGDAFFQSGRYPEAITVYDGFLAKFPKHPQAAFALFRNGACLDKQSPEAIDREQRYSERALETYASYLEKYPEGAEVPQVKERIQVLRQRIAGHYLFVARFYWKKSLYQSALYRYLEILQKFPMYPEMKAESVSRAAEAYERLAKMLEKDPNSDAFSSFKGETPESLRAKAQEILKSR